LPVIGLALIRGCLLRALAIVIVAAKEFVVQNATLITVELGSKDTKHLNNKDGTSPLKLCEYYKNHNFKKILTLSEFEKIRKDYRQDLDKN